MGSTKDATSPKMRRATPASLAARLTGDVRTFALPHRIANGILLTMAVACAVSTVANTVVGASLWMVLIVGSMSTVHAGLYAWSRFGRAFPSPSWISFLILVVGFYPAVWWSNFGLHGGNHMIGIALFATSASQFTGWRRNTAAVLVVVTTAALMVLEFSHPGTIPGYASPWAQTRDHFITFALVGGGLHLLNRVTDRNYATEREKAHEYAAIVDRTNHELEEALATNRQLAHSDALTQLPNRRYFESLFGRRVEESQRYERPLALAVLDIDHFKSVNDRHGHAVGDKIIAGLGRSLAEEKRTVDVAARWGGEEFVIMCPETAIEGAEVVAERLRAAVEAALYVDGVPITISIGLAAARPDEEPMALFERADAALYAAKHGGRNRVVVAGPAASKALPLTSCRPSTAVPAVQQ